MNRFKYLMLLGFIFLLSSNSNAQMLLTLEDALEIAKETSPSMRQSKLNMETNKEYLNAQLASMKSKFSFDVTPISYKNEETYNEYFSDWYTTEEISSRGSLRIAQPIKWTDGLIILQNDFAYQDTYSESSSGSSGYTGFNNYLYLQITQPLFTYNRTEMNLERNQLNLEVSTLNYSIELLNMERQVTQAFYLIYQKQLALQISKEEYENQKVSKDIIERKVEGGLAAREELLQAELNLSTSKSNMENAQVDLDNALDEFKRLIGLSLYEDIEVEANVDFQPVAVDLEKAIDNGLEQRMELRQKDIDIEKANFNLIETSSTNEFRGDVNLSIGLMGNDESLMDIYDKPTRSPQVGVTFSIPIFDWGERKARIRAAELQVESTKIEKESLEDDIILNIRKVYRNLNNLITQIEIAEQNEENAQLTYEINLERYRNGDLTSMDLERYQTQLSEKKMNLANALINYKLELLNMKIQSLWDFEENTSFIPQDLQENLKSE